MIVCPVQLLVNDIEDELLIPTSQDQLDGRRSPQDAREVGVISTIKSPGHHLVYLTKGFVVHHTSRYKTDKILQS